MRVFAIFFQLCILQVLVTAQEVTFTNPIIPGGYPDPSICRVGEDYYIVNSSFEYFPGLPIHHSKDLVNWELVSYGLHRPEQCTGRNNLVDVQQRGGIHAPTIRYHKGQFYIITTNVYSPIDKTQPTQFINFIITAADIRGPWSDPHVLEGAPGIDPDIFFDEDGRVWYLGTHAPENPNFNGEGEIWLQELDLENWRLIGERYFLWRGACAGTWAEGPHVYMREGRYYLLIAEGGTSYNHAVMVAVSDSITGPYVSSPRNPILTTRNLSYDNWVNSTGHADMVELPDGRWYMVALGIRGDEERRSNMGRETHLIPATWEREPQEWKKIKYEWPVIAPRSGRVLRNTPLPFSGKKQLYNDSFHDNFDAHVLHLAWNFRRVPRNGIFSLDKRRGYMRLFHKPETIALRGRCSLMGFRQKESSFVYTASMEYGAQQIGEAAGVSIFQQDDNYLMFLLEEKEEGMFLKLLVRERKKDVRLVQERALPEYSGEILLRISSQENRYLYSYSLDQGATFTRFFEGPSNWVLSHGYTGAYLGIYATSNGKESQAYADFDWVSYKGFPSN
ncbi:MAG: glycoside hydrolase family 43 protein [Bacteroidota bacterium]